MAISEAAQRNHDELFPGHISTLADTDPELIEYFDNFAFGEVSNHGSLDTRTRLIVQLAALIGCQALREYRVMLGAALTVGVTPVEIKEVVYQAVPYVGMGKVFDFLHATNDVLTERGINLPQPGQSPRRRRLGWNDRVWLIDVVTQLLPFIGYPPTLNAINAINEITPTPTTPPEETQ